MILSSLKLLMLLIIAVPFVYIFVDVIIDISKQFYNLYKVKAKPALVYIYSIFNQL